MKSSRNVSGVILAGGKSSRLGSDKALLKIDGRRIVDWILSVFQNFFTDIVIVANNVDPYEKHDGVRVVRDVVEGIGPLGGLHAGLQSIQNEYAFFVACDMPYLHIELVELLLRKLDNGRPEAIVATHDGKIEPLCAIYSKRLIPAIMAKIDQHDFKLHSFLQSIKALPVDFSDTQWSTKSFLNINTQEDYRRETLK